ncbi:hypothetical protein CERSUDRAFT_115622 [Gelatoporia subvermispora B]|uniref:Origin recognition complex subunit 5 n=1 Tax=Ceriporiopsis subvermispora (strain B) TaxID=914234 RepID=M2RDR0_CERS8|nr:hypothetical protein CERSUDRAFT_115622 [Gelatoporia subvermispora B]
MDPSHTALRTPGFGTSASLLSTLLASYPPPFISIYDPENPRLTASVVRNAVTNLQEGGSSGGTAKIHSAIVNAVACFTPRLFYDSVLNALAEWEPSWEDGCNNWSGLSTMPGQRFNENFDAFVHGLQAVKTYLEQASNETPKAASGKWKGKAKATSTNEGEVYRLVIVIERAERLKQSMPELLVPLTRLAELTQLDVTIILLSDLRWEEFRPPLGAAPDPFYIDIPLLSKSVPDTIDIVTSAFDHAAGASVSSSFTDPEAYSAVLRPLYSQFSATLFSICSPFIHNVHELMYLAAARWPGFIKPVLDAHRAYVQEMERLRVDRQSHEAEDSGAESRDDMQDHYEAGMLYLPSEDTRIRLIRHFTPSITIAVENLYPRLAHAAEWSRANMPPADLLTLAPGHMPGPSPPSAGPVNARDVRAFPRTSKFVLVAAFLASTNPAKTDLRMFGRGASERTRRVRRGVSPRKAKAGTGGAGIKIPQRLLGPLPFPLERLLAILGVLLEEHDAEVRPQAPEFAIPGEYTDMEISRVSVHAAIMELASMRLLTRASSADKVDATPTFKCGISYDVALQLARDLGILLNDLLWDSV